MERKGNQDMKNNTILSSKRKILPVCKQHKWALSSLSFGDGSDIINLVIFLNYGPTELASET